eukprot:gene11157-13182_t
MENSTPPMTGIYDATTLNRERSTSRRSLFIKHPSTLTNDAPLPQIIEFVNILANDLNNAILQLAQTDANLENVMKVAESLATRIVSIEGNYISKHAFDETLQE